MVGIYPMLSRFLPPPIRCCTGVSRFPDRERYGIEYDSLVLKLKESTIGEVMVWQKLLCEAFVKF